MWLRAPVAESRERSNGNNDPEGSHSYRLLNTPFQLHRPRESRLKLPSAPTLVFGGVESRVWLVFPLTGSLAPDRRTGRRIAFIFAEPTAVGWCQIGRASCRERLEDS